MTSEENSETVPLTSRRFNASSHMESVLYIMRMTRESSPQNSSLTSECDGAISELIALGSGEVHCEVKALS